MLGVMPPANESPARQRTASEAAELEVARGASPKPGQSDPIERMQHTNVFAKRFAASVRGRDALLRQASSKRIVRWVWVLFVVVVGAGVVVGIVVCPSARLPACLPAYLLACT